MMQSLTMMQTGILKGIFFNPNLVKLEMVSKSFKLPVTPYSDKESTYINIYRVKVINMQEIEDIIRDKCLAMNEKHEYIGFFQDLINNEDTKSLYVLGATYESTGDEIKMIPTINDLITLILSPDSETETKLCDAVTTNANQCFIKPIVTSDSATQLRKIVAFQTDVNFTGSPDSLKDQVRSIISSHAHIVKLISLFFNDMIKTYNEKHYPADTIVKALSDCTVMDERGIHRLSISDIEAIWDVVKSRLTI